MTPKNFCPVCGFDKLKEKVKNEAPSYEICPCCGFEFGFDDDVERCDYQIYRKKWIKNGADWFIKERKPKDWSLKKQLSNIGIFI